MKSKIIGRRQLLIGTLAITFCLAVFVNWYYTKPVGEQQNEPKVTENTNLGEAQYVNGNKVSEETDYFSKAKLKRTKAHDDAKAHLETIIADTKIDEETKKQAREKMINMSAEIKNEADIENLISAQTNGECLVTLSNENAEIILPKGSINDELLVKIKDIVISKTSLSADRMTIIELK